MASKPKPKADGDNIQQFIPKAFKPKTDGQHRLWTSLQTNSVVIAVGPAGTGKTYLAISAAVMAKQSDEFDIDRIILTRPAVEAGESLGFLPGAMEEKLAPYLRPLYDALSERMGAKALKADLAEKVIEIAPVGFMRGRTLNNAFVVIDEAQNLTFAQIKMLLTRLGHKSTMVLTGDPDQSDLPHGESGFLEVIEKLSRLNADGIDIVRLTNADIVRHPLVAKMLTVL